MCARPVSSRQRSTAPGSPAWMSRPPRKDLDNVRRRVFQLLLAALWMAQANAAVLFEGARVIVDARRPPIENAALLVDNGRIVKVGKKGAVQTPPGTTRVDLTGKTVMPSLIDAHVHLGYQKGL